MSLRTGLAGRQPSDGTGAGSTRAACGRLAYPQAARIGDGDERRHCRPLFEQIIRLISWVSQELARYQRYCILRASVIVRRFAALADRRDDLCVSPITPESWKKQIHGPSRRVLTDAPQGDTLEESFLG